MTVNTDKHKSAIMPIGHDVDKNPIMFQIHGRSIDSCKYIGFTLTADGKWTQHVEKAIN
jgi:hypothetical protein